MPVCTGCEKVLMAHGDRHKLTYEENYLLGYMEGYRIGSIKVTREILIRCLKIKAREQGFASLKDIIQKINRDVDTAFLQEILFYVMKDKISVRELEMCYDMVFLVLNEERNIKSLWIKPAKKEVS